MFFFFVFVFVFLYSAVIKVFGFCILTDSTGFVHFLGRDLTITSFQAYEMRVSHFYQLKQQNILFTVGVSALYSVKQINCVKYFPLHLNIIVHILHTLLYTFLRF